jgi:LPS-assembly lipoprotein
MIRISRRGLLALGTCATVAGCGFRPVYMPTASGKAGPAQRELAAVTVDLIPDRPGQLLRQALQERLAGGASGMEHRYNLAVNFWIAGEALGIQQDTVATYIRLIGRASWRLIAQDPARTTLTTGNSRVFDDFNILDQQYFASDLENEAGQRRIAETTADQIALQLAVFFRKRADTTG